MSNDQKNVKIESKKIDSVNLLNAKIDLSKGKNDLRNIEGIKTSSKSLYIGLDDLSSEEKKKRRGKIRRDLNNYVNDILGKDRNPKEVEDAVFNFLAFYKENWKVTDFRIENFSEKKNPADLRNYKNLLDYVKSVIGMD